MSGLKILSVTALLAVALVAVPATPAGALDQNPKAGSGDPPRGGGGGPQGGGQAVPRNEGAPPPPPSTAGASGGGWTGGGQGAAGGGAWRGAERRSPQAEGRAAPRSRGTASGGGAAVPGYSRPRGDRPVTGEAVPRRGSPSGPPNYPGSPGYGGYYPGYGGGYYPGYDWGHGYYPWGIGMLGLGYFYWDPYGWSYPAYGGYGGYGGYGDEGYGYGRSMYAAGGIRLKVKPSDAQVYVDGYFAGTVDQFDSWYQKLALGFGSHRIEIRKAGYAPLIFEVSVESDDTITYHGQLEPGRVPGGPVSPDAPIR